MEITFSMLDAIFVAYLSSGKTRVYKLPFSIKHPLGDIDSVELTWSQNSRALIKVKVGCLVELEGENVFCFEREVSFDDSSYTGTEKRKLTLEIN
jgi:hypothetical protein